VSTHEFYRSERTIVNVQPPPWRVGLGDSLFAIGSCFADSFYHFFEERFLNVHGNHFGPVYNPVSLADSVRRLVMNEPVQPEEVFYHQGLHRHFAFHAAAARPSKDQFLGEANARIDEGHRVLLEAKLLVITLGTAFVYRDEQTGRGVNNCHTLPASRFRRARLTIQDATDALVDALDEIRQVNSSIHILVSVSPVRHLRDAPEENSVSKAILRCVADELCQESGCVYFPAYEIMLDELRDYRYYAGDLCHPSDRATRYIMEKMGEALLDGRGRQYLQDVEKLRRMLSHSPRHPDSPQHARFQELMCTERSRLAEHYPELPRLMSSDGDV
jgi:hypothetical protein